MIFILSFFILRSSFPLPFLNHTTSHSLPWCHHSYKHKVYTHCTSDIDGRRRTRQRCSHQSNQPVRSHRILYDSSTHLVHSIHPILSHLHPTQPLPPPHSEVISPMPIQPNIYPVTLPFQTIGCSNSILHPLLNPRLRGFLFSQSYLC